ncbi:MAG: c-type cytochrome domain-containing protein [Planctomycetota bacterium]
MHHPLRTAARAVVVACLFVACDTGAGRTSAASIPVVAPRVESARTTGDADALAGALLLAAGASATAPLQPTAAGGVTDPALALQLASAALDHLRSRALGAGHGPDLLGSQRVLRLARADDAPIDANGDGRNVDETLAAETVRLAAFAGAPVPSGVRQPLLPWAEGSPDLAAAPGAAVAFAGDPARWRTRDVGSSSVRLLDVAGMMQARVLAASNLLAQRRGGLAGATADAGLLGLLLVEQVLATEEELVTRLGTDGALLGTFGDLADYDPAQGPRWLPAQFDAIDQGTGAPALYRVLDGASDLEGLAAVLDAVAELAWFAGDANPSAAVQAVFETAFPPPEPVDPPEPALSWDGEIRNLVVGRCQNCHLGFPTGGFQIDTYALFLQGGNRTRQLQLPMVVPGDHTRSFAYEILTAPRFPFPRMPPGIGQELSPTELQMVADWIDQGALEQVPSVPPPPAPGEDLARASFRNLVALHLDRRSGALFHRRENDGPVPIATAAATGRALSALTRLWLLQPDLEYDGVGVEDVIGMAASFAARRLVGPDGAAFEFADLADGGAGGAAGLGDQAVLTAGMLEAARVVALPEVDDAALRLVERLLRHRDPAGHFQQDLGHGFARYTPRLLADLLAALRLAAQADAPDAAAAQTALLQRLRPALAFAEWQDGGETPGDGAADTDGDGVPEPLLAGGAFGRLPLLAGAILVGDAADAPPADGGITWTRHVRPLLLQKCGACHMSGSREGGYSCDTVRQLARPGDSGFALPLLVPGDPEASLLYRKLVDRLPPVGQQMPLSGSLLDERGRDWIRRWIADGALAR